MEGQSYVPEEAESFVAGGAENFADAEDRTQEEFDSAFDVIVDEQVGWGAVEAEPTDDEDIVEEQELETV